MGMDDGISGYKPSLSIMGANLGRAWNISRFCSQTRFLKCHAQYVGDEHHHMVLGFVTAITLALLLNELRNLVFKRTVQTISYLPHFSPGSSHQASCTTAFTTEGGIVNECSHVAKDYRQAGHWLGEGEYFWGIYGLSSMYGKTSVGTRSYIWPRSR